MNEKLTHRVNVSWRKIGLFQVLICFEEIPQETTVEILVDGKPVKAAFDEEGCLVYGDKRLIPKTVQELCEWARGIWAGLIPLVPDTHLVWEDGIWNTCQQIKSEEILRPLLHIKGLNAMNSMMQAMTSSSSCVVEYVAVMTCDQPPEDLCLLEVAAYDS